MDSKVYNDAQEGLIKSLIASPEDILTIAQSVTVDDFDNANYAVIYSSILALVHDGEVVSLPGILLKATDKDPEVHIDPNWLLSLDSDMTKWVAKAPASTWARIVKDQAAKKKTIDAYEQAIADLKQTDVQAVSVIGEVTTQTEEIAMKSLDGTETTNLQRTDKYLDYMETRLECKKNVIPTPYPSVDKQIVGYLPGQLITIGARTSVGKSVVATQSAITSCVANKSTLLFSLEMSENEVIDRMISAMSGVELSAIRTRKLSMEERVDFDKAIERFRQFKIDIDENPAVTIEYIKNRATRKAQSAEGLDMIIIDYLQLVTHDKRGASREQIVAEMSREMKKLAKQLQVPVMILAQLNRESRDEEDDHLPKISDIRESGAIAADSDVILLIHRKLTTDEIDPKALFIIGKNRNGQPGKKISVRCALEYAKFIDEGMIPQLNDGKPEETFPETETFGNDEFGASPFSSSISASSVFDDEDY